MCINKLNLYDLGKTIESALPIMSRNKSGIIVQGAANKADLNYKYDKLQLILIDEIRLES